MLASTQQNLNEGGEVSPSLQSTKRRRKTGNREKRLQEKKGEKKSGKMREKSNNQEKEKIYKWGVGLYIINRHAHLGQRDASVPGAGLQRTREGLKRNGFKEENIPGGTKIVCDLLFGGHEGEILQTPLIL